MPQLIEYIDAIARKKQRDVLYVTFTPKYASIFFDLIAGCDDDVNASDERNSYSWEEDPMREKVCKWLTEHNVTWRECDHFASENGWFSYEGQIYLDVPYDENDLKYQLVRNFLENPDGSMCFESVTLWLVPLEQAMENKHHDESGFWRKWGKNF
ncbi:hypothetical protein [Crenothrix sp.]|uniref:hypothetical protein n=1 Tax=Crenothrix sp. TaxID=3100433 RepID=UPI00374C8F43